MLHLPAWTIQISAALIFLSTLRPIAAGALQGSQNFIAFGFTRLALALGRLILLFFLIQVGLHLEGAVIALPFGWLVSVLCAFLLLGKPFWTRSKSAAQSVLREGWKLSFYALLAYLAYMSLTSLDLVWVNQNLSGELAGAYAGLVLMRRIVALLPGVAVIVMFPRVVRTLAEGQSPNHILAETAAIIIAVSGTLSILYFVFADQLITIVFGESQPAAASLLGWMGIAMIGVSLSSIWLNYYLAEKPRNFVILLGIAVGARMDAVEPLAALLAKRGSCIWHHGLAAGAWWIIALHFQTCPCAAVKYMSDFNDLYRQHQGQMEDFWSRRANAPRYEKIIHVFGQPVLFDSNHEGVLKAATLAEQMYSTRNVRDEPPWRVHLTVHDSDPQPPPPPERLIDLVHYAGADDWLSIDLRAWGHCFVDMKRGEAYAVLSSSIAENPSLVCQVLLNTILNNFATRHGFSMLHASALVKDESILVLQAPHGTGKSTTALRLLLNGYQLLSDSQIYLYEENGVLWMGGFPIGRIKLRADMLPHFPVLAAEAQTEPVRNETKHRVDLMRVDPALTCQEMIRVERVEFCLLERWDKSESELEPLSSDELWREIMVNSLHYDTPEIWNENLQRVDFLLRNANLHRLRIGTSEDDIRKTVNQLW